MQIDSFTILVAACTGIFLFGTAFAFFWWQDRKASWLAWWIGPYFLGALSIVLFGQRGAVNDWISIGLSNSLILAGFGMVWQGARAFSHRSPSIWLAMAPGAVWLLLCALPGYLASQSLRVVVASAISAGLTAMTAIELHRDRAEVLPSRTAAVVVLVSLSIFFSIRIPLVGMLPFPMGGGELNANWLALLNLTIFVHVGAFAFLMVSMTKERREAEQRNFAMLDPLTGLMNRRAFMSAVERAQRRRTGYGRRPLSLMVLDLDSFKQINDRFGHDAGDRVLVQFAQVAEAITRPTDQLYRMGGEEFCFILPDTELADAIGAAERIRQTFEMTSIEARGLAVNATVSIGIASTDHAGFDLELLHEAADSAVYEAKARGRNQVVVAGATGLRRPMPGVRKRA